MDDKRSFLYKGIRFYHGDKVACIIEGEPIDDARTSINKNNTRFICHNNDEVDGQKAHEMFGYTYSWFFSVFDDKLTDGVGGLYRVEPQDELVAALNNVL